VGGGVGLWANIAAAPSTRQSARVVSKRTFMVNPFRK
jgi:hypothetical protein